MPSGTTLRFATLVVLAIATTLHVFGQYAATWPPATSLDSARCQVRSDLYLTSTYAVDPDEAKWARYRDCMSAFLGPRLVWLLAGLVLLSAVALVIYFAWPRRRIRRSRLVPLEGALADELRDTLAELVAKAGLREAPEFVLDPTRWRAGGVAFGHHRRKVVCLDVGLVALHRRDPESFRAIVLHELAHVRDDVTTTYATLAVWRAFLVVVLAPYLLVLINPMLLSRTPWRLPDLSLPGTATTWGVAWRLVLLVVLVYLARTAVLRSREKHADAMVVRWTGVDDPYRNLSPTRSIRRWIATHPTRAARLAAMRDPDSLLRPGFRETLASALAVQVAWWHAVAGLRELTWYREGNASFLVMRVAWALAAAVLVGVIAWRGAASLRASGPRRGVFAVPGLALGLGFAIGDRLDAQNVTPITPLGAAALALLVVTTLLVCCWAGHCATLARTGRHGVLIAAATAAVCFGVLGWFGEARVADATWREDLRPMLDLLHGYAASTVDAVVLDAVAIPFTLNFNRVPTAVALVLVWLVPLVLRRELPRVAVPVGLAGGVVASLVIVALGSADDPSSALVLTAWGLLLTAAVQLAVAVVVARRAGRVDALLATWLTGLVATGATWWAHLDGTHVDSVLATRPHQVLPFLGTVAGLVGGLVASRRVASRQGAARPAKPPAVALIAVVSVGVVSWWPASAGAAPLLPPRVTGEVDRDEAVNTWIYGDGWDRYSSVVTTNNEVFEAVTAEDPAAIALACDALLPVLRDAGAFPPPPEERIRSHWTSALRSLEDGARACLRVFREGREDDGVMGARFVSGLEQLEAVRTLLVEAQRRALD